jgi:hypothetical protein
MKALVNYGWFWLLGAVIFGGGCLSPHGGPEFLYWFSPPKVEVVGDGSSPETPLQIRHSAASALNDVESSWLFRHYGTTYEVMDQTFDARVTVRTERIGKHVMDIATLAMPDGSTRIAYFDVTDYRK